MNDIFNRIANAAPTEDDRHPWIGAGNHHLIVHEARKFKSTKHGMALAVDFYVESGDTHSTGSLVTQAFYVHKNPRWPGDESELQRTRDFAVALTGCSPESAGEQLRAIFEDPAAAQSLRANPAQPARGLQIKSFGNPVQKKNSEGVYVVITFANVDQTPAQVAQLRAALPAIKELATPAARPFGMASTDAPAPAPAPNPTPNPAPASESGILSLLK